MMNLADEKEVRLLNQVKRKLNITWEDADTNQRLFDVILSVRAKMIYKLGIIGDDFDFSAPGMENELFLNACFYEWNHASDEFYKNYADEIDQCRWKYEVLQNAEQN